MDETKHNETATQSVEMTAEELEAYKAFKAENEKRQAALKKQRDLEAYRELVDETIESLIPRFDELAGEMRAKKQEAIKLLAEVIRMKREVIGLKDGGQYSHTFMTSDGTKRIRFGTNTTDGYLDTVNEGIELVTRYITSLAQDAKTQSLVEMVMRLLAKDASGNLKASRVVQLRKIAEDTGDEAFLEGVRLIEDSYRPTVSKLYLRIERRGSEGEWQALPLSVTDTGSKYEEDETGDEVRALFAGETDDRTSTAVTDQTPSEP